MDKIQKRTECSKRTGPSERLTLLSVLRSAAVLCLMLWLCVLTAAAAERKTVRVGYFPFDGYHMESESGEKSGYGYDILQKMRRYENWNYEYLGYEENVSWDAAQDMLVNGQVDLLTSATKSEERLKLFDYSELPIGSSSTTLRVKAGDNRYETGDYSTWNNLRVGMLTGNTRNDSFRTYANQHGFRFQQMEYDTPDELGAELKAGKLDMIVTSNLLTMDGVQVVDRFDEKPFYVIVKKGNTALLSQVNDALGKVLETEPAFADLLYKTYYTAPSDGVVSFTREEQRFIDECNQNGVAFQALINPDRKPLSYRQGGVPKGLLTDICQEIFNRTGLKIQFIEAENRDQYVENLKNGVPDILCDYTGSSGGAENFGFIKTNPYYNSSTSMLVKKGYLGGGKYCALTKSSITNQKLFNQEGIEYKLYDTMEECQDAVMSGEVDFSYGYTRSIQEMVYADVTNSLACITVTYMPVDFSMGVNLRDDALLTSIISKAVNSIEEKDLSYLSEPYTYYDRPKTSLVGLVYEHPIVILSCALLLFAAGIIIILMIMEIRKHRAEKKLNGELSEALSAAERANQAKTSFLSRVSHDMRTPLNGILGLTGLLKEKAVFMKTEHPDVLDDLEELELSGRYLLNLINDTLDISRIESGKLELHPAVCGGKKVLDNTIRLANINARAKNIQLNVELEPLPFTLLYADMGRVQQILMNILSNAIKFTPEGGTVALFIRNLSVENGVITDEYTVADTGIGIKPEYLPHIFEAFSQEDSSRTSTSQGTGLGLAITKQLLDAMGGTISVESEPGKGTKFTFTIPMRIATEEQIKADSQAGGSELDSEILHGKRVLLCEDHPLNTKIATRLLEEKNMLVDHAENGQLGLTMFAASAPGYYDLILMDIRMPVMDGLEAARKIRSLSRLDAQKIPIIAMTANAFDEDMKQTREAGMNEHLGKPIETKTLYGVMERLLKETETGTGT